MAESDLRSNIADLLTLVCVSVAASLGFANELLGNLVTELPTTLLVGLAASFAAIAALLQRYSMMRTAENIEQSVSERADIVPEHLYHERVASAYREGYSRGQFEGYKEGARERAGLADNRADSVDRTGSEQHQTDEKEPDSGEYINESEHGHDRENTDSNDTSDDDLEEEFS